MSLGYVQVIEDKWLANLINFQGLAMNEKIMPQYFKDAGYRTSMIGKWHLGFHQRQYTPANRGFDSFFGYYGPYIDYFDYTLEMFNRNYSRGYDMRRDFTTVDNLAPTYATELFTNEAVDVIKKHDKKKPLFMLLSHLAPHAGNEDFPVQAPEEEIAKFSYIEDEERRTLAGKLVQCSLLRKYYFKQIFYQP